MLCLNFNKNRNKIFYFFMKKLEILSSFQKPLQTITKNEQFCKNDFLALENIFYKYLFINILCVIFIFLYKYY